MLGNRLIKSVGLRNIRQLSSQSVVQVNGVKYQLPEPGRPVVAICLDGTSKDYLDAASEAGVMPRYTALVGSKLGPEDLFANPLARGSLGVVSSIMPTFTNPNNMAIITGVPSSVHGICGNYLFDEESQKEVSMNDPKFLRCGTILSALNKAGVKIGVVTSKDKLRPLLCHELVPGNFFGFSAEKADFPETQTALQTAGVNATPSGLMQRAAPSIYDPDISIYTLEAGLRYLEHQIRQLGGSIASLPPTLLYLSTTDYVQHKYRPGSEGANQFFAKIDRVLGGLHDLGAIVGFTADHGMSDKVDYHGKPKAIYLETVLGAANIPARVVLPITDPYVVHHGAFGSFATIYLANKSDERAALDVLRQQSGLYTALNREEAVKSLELPGDRIGDLVVIGDCNTVLGRRPEAHDLSALGNTALRSHGGLDEQVVPLWINRPLTKDYARRLSTGKGRNYHLLEFLLNGTTDLQK